MNKPKIDKLNNIIIDEDTCNCSECGKEISREEWKENAKMCKWCYDKDGYGN
jgi:hypothetical protein